MSAPMLAGRSAASTQSNLEQRRARRAEMRQFYGLKSPEAAKPAQSLETPEFSPHTVSEMDDPTFDPKAYYDGLIANATLPELLQTVSTLAADIGNLQGSRHALVYNHHHQLFAAGDTISHLNSRTPQLLGIMTKLQQSFSEISRLAEEVSMDGTPDGEVGVDWMSEEVRLEMLLAANAATTDLEARYEMLKSREPGGGGHPVLTSYQRVLSDRAAGQQTP